MQTRNDREQANARAMIYFANIYFFFLHELHFQYAVRIVCVVSACALCVCVCECAEQQQINPVLMVKTLRIIQFDCTRARSGWEKLLFFSLLTQVFCESLFWVYIDSIAPFCFSFRSIWLHFLTLFTDRIVFHPHSSDRRCILVETCTCSECVRNTCFNCRQSELPAAIHTQFATERL